jgi:hypothetical protein
MAMMSAPLGAGLAGVNLQVNVDLGAVVELADGLGIALMAFVLGVDLVVDGAGKGGEAIGAIGSDDVAFDGAGAAVGEVNDGVGERVILQVEDLTEKKAAGRFILLRQAAGRQSECSECQASHNRRYDRRILTRHSGSIVSRQIEWERLTGKVQSGIFAFFVVDMDFDFLGQTELGAVGKFQVFGISGKNVVGFAGGNTLGEFTVMVRVLFPTDFLGLIGGAADFHPDAVDGTIVRAPDCTEDQSIGLPRLLWSGSEGASTDTEKSQDHEEMEE